MMSVTVDKIDILMWIMGVGFAGLGSMMLFLHNSLASRMDGIEQRIDKLDEKLTDVDRRLCRIEGSMMNKDCCMLKSGHRERVE